MAHGRWYPTVIMLGDGRIMAFSGTDENANTNHAVDLYRGVGLESGSTTLRWTPPLYPRLHLLPNGKVFAFRAERHSYLFNPSNQSWSTDCQHETTAPTVLMAARFCSR